MIPEEYLKPGPPPNEGLSLEEVIAAMRVLDSAQEVSDKRVLALRVHQTGAVLVRTGLRIGGSDVVLQKRAGEWVITDHGRWFS
jgi:hypothetical protein